jgi:DNA-binding beta-propeller fold protein YncE
MTRAQHAWRCLAAAWPAGLLVALLLSVPIAAQKKQDAPVATPAAPKTDPKQLVWPLPPDVPRIQWLAQVSGQDDLTPPPPKKKKKLSWKDKLAGIQPMAEREAKAPALAKPFGVAVDTRGRIYAADTGQRQVFAFDLENKQVQFLPGKFVQPMAVAVDDADRVFVVDSRQRMVMVFSPAWEQEAAFGREHLERPVAAAVDNENRFLYVVDAQASRLAVFDADQFNFLRYLGGPSDPLDPAEGTFATPLGVAVDGDGNVFVTDTLNDRIQVFDADGNFLRQFGRQGVTAGTFMRAKGIAVDTDGHIYVTDAEFNNVQIFDQEGRTLGVFGSYGTEPGQFALVTGIAIDANNRVVVADQWRARLQLFRYFTDQEAEAMRRESKAPVRNAPGKSSAPP